MADVRALLKAKRQEAKITHPLAAYSSTGQLRCVACGTAVKHASAWEGHIGSKVHRTNVARLKEEERAQAERARAEAEAQAHAAAEAEKQMASPVARGKRKAQDDDVDMDEVEMEAEPKEDNGAKRRRVGPTPGGFPADFFSDPSRAPIPIPDEDGDDEDIHPEPPAKNGGPPPPADQSSVIDLEYERFQRELLGADPNAPDARQETYERATVVADPELLDTDEVPAGFSAQDQQMDPEAEKEKQSEEELARRRKEQEERELIMDRLLDEERAQEEADQRVAVMKARLEALKKKRASKKTMVAEPSAP